ncbi:hypothetical protein R1sor_019468 [Riccia sorocarpa]|uniref:Signal recognition particle subunit SRP68 n=1 Tax=Riccia sorocarpa TaxID=122646 RepID=A0ABD3IDP7_9MARC
MTVAAMEVDGAGTDRPAPKFSFNVLQLIKTAQFQHGLRLGDYKRYRRYCTARLMRLYKSLNFKHGRGKYIRKDITEATVTDVRYLHVVLYSAERAWSYAMEIKSSGAGANARQQAHLIRRLTKAAKWADLLNRLCSEKADSRTGLEALAYAEQMRGNLLLERGTDWETALKKFKSARPAPSRKVYDELGKFGDVENQVMCRQRVEELDSMIKFCMYEMGRADLKGSDLLGLSTQEGPAFDLLQSKLEAVMAEARTQQAVSMTELEFLGRKFPVKNPKTRVCILKGQELLKELEATAPTNTEKKLSIFDKLFIAYHDAKRHIRDDLAVAGTAEDVREELNGLDRAVSSILLQRTIERNLFLVTNAKARLARAQKGLREEKGEKPAKPEDLVRLYDTLIQNVTDLSELVTSGRDTSAKILSFAKDLEAQRVGFQAGRCYYLSMSYNVAAKYPEAYALMRRAQEHAESAIRSWSQSSAPDEVPWTRFHLRYFGTLYRLVSLWVLLLWCQLTEPDSVLQNVMQDLKSLNEDCRAQKCLIHARAVTEEQKSHDAVQKGVGSLSLSKDASKKKEAGYLLDKLDVYESVLGAPGSKEQARIFQILPSFESVPCRPIVLDTALDAIEFPSLEGRLKKDEKKGFLNKWSLFGR